jgi:hypothetical protein
MLYLYSFQQERNVHPAPAATTMPKTTLCKVVNNRFLFRCSSCGAKRRMSAPPHLRRKNIRCYKCATMNTCAFNRRITPREQQSGKAVLLTTEGREVDINLTDISSKGIGVELSIKALRSRAVRIGDQVQLICNWNPKLFAGSRFVIQNIRDQRVGIRKLETGEF